MVSCSIRLKIKLAIIYCGKGISLLYSHEGTMEYEQLVALVGGGVREAAPDYVADMSGASYETAVERFDLAPADWPGRVAILRRQPDDRGRG